MGGMSGGMSGMGTLQLPFLAFVFALRWSGTASGTWTSSPVPA